VSEKPLAQIAFEAATAGTGILWEKLDDANRKAWVRAAEAVADALAKRANHRRAA
jgi:hypothetical protein